jgi:hypothetical protein
MAAIGGAFQRFPFEFRLDDCYALMLQIATSKAGRWAKQASAAREFLSSAKDLARRWLLS